MRIPWFLLVSCLAAGNLPASGFLDLSSRWQSRDFYSAVYQFGNAYEMGWTGSYQDGNAGTVSELWLEATRVRINYFRKMAGVPDNIVFDPAKSAAAQEAALMMSANGQLNHFPPANWQWYTEDGATAAQNSNLAIGSTGPSAVEGYIVDPGPGNYATGHRRWILYPSTTVMGSGDVPGDDESGLHSANAIWVIPSSIGPRPETRNPFIAWPPMGHVPSTLVFPRWSFSHPEADFSSATVQMDSGGSSIPLTIEPVANGYGDNTIVWVPDGMSSGERTSWPTPEEDEVISVTVQNVMVEGSSRQFSYDVIIYDPASTGPEEQPTMLDTSRNFYPSIPIKVPVETRPWSEAVQGRIVSTVPHNQVYGGENDIIPFIASISDDYTPLQSGRVADGSRAFHLVMPDGNSQALRFPAEYLVTSPSARLLYKSSLAYATEAQIASVQVSLGSSGNWTTIWSKSGPVQQNNSFSSVELDLSPWLDKVLRVRFLYSWDHSASYYFNTESFAGWAIDTVFMEGVSRVTSSEEFPIQSGNENIVATFGDTSPVYLQARELAFGGFPLDWGPAYFIEPQAYDQVEMSEGNWHEDPVFGWLFGYGGGWAYSHTFSWVNASYFPWVWTPVGWFHYLEGSTYSILWLYHQEFGYTYTESNLGGWFKHEPFGDNDWKKFQP